MAKKSATPKEPQAPVLPFLGDKDGINVTALDVDGGGFLVKYGFDRQLTRMVRQIEGATFDAEWGGYAVPATSVESLGKMVGAMRAETKGVAEDLAAIMELATNSGLAAQRDNKTERGVKPMVSEFIEPGRFYGGEVLNANARFIAQFSGFGKENGAAFITIHRSANLNQSRILKGEKLGIVYDEKFLGSVSDLTRHKSDAQLEADYTQELGEEIDGVTLTDRGDKLGVAFDMNPALMNRIRRLDGAAFNQTDKVWEIPQKNREYVLRAVQDMRNEFVADGKDVEMLRGIADSKLDGAKVGKAFTKDGLEHFGPVVAVGDRYVLQKAGGNKFSLHHLDALNDVPVVGQNLSIKYNRGTGVVVDQDRQRAQQMALSR